MREGLKKLTLFILLMVSTVCAGAVELISRQVEQNGILIDASEILPSPTPVTVFTNDPSLKGEWTVEHLMWKGGYYLNFIKETSDGKCVINPDEMRWYEAHYHDCEDKRHVAYIVRVTFTSESGLEDSIELKIILLPTRPTISVTHYTYTYDWSDDTIFPNCNMGLNLYSENAVDYILWESESYIFSFPGIFQGGYFYDANPNEVTYVEFDPDWGEYLGVEARNRYGSVLGDIIYTTDYIDDPLILARIEEIRKGAAVETVTDKVASFRLDQDRIAFESTIDSALIYDISGTLVVESPATASLDISSLSQGIYILSYTVNSTTQQVKFQKK